MVSVDFPQTGEGGSSNSGCVWLHCVMQICTGAYGLFLGNYLPYSFPTAINISMIKQFTHLDYTILVEWWDFHKTPAMPLESIPPTSFFSLDENNYPQAFVSLYLTNSNIAWGETLVTRPNSTREERAPHLAKVLEYITYYCQQRSLVLLALSDRASVNFHLEKSGFTRSGDSFYLYSISPTV